MFRPKNASIAVPGPIGGSAGRSTLINLLIFIVVLYVFGSQLSGLSGSLQAIKNADIVLVGLSFLLLCLACIAAALALLALAAGRIAFLPTLNVQIASGFVNRLLPGGLGSIGLYAVYLKKRGLSLAAASAVVLTNNILGLLGNLILLLAVMITRPPANLHLNVAQPKFRVWFIVAAVPLITAGLLLFANFRRKQSRVAKNIMAEISAVLSVLRPNRHTALALLANMMLTALNAAIVCFSVAAVGGTISWQAALLVLSFGTLLGAAVPTPGGIGGVEAGLLAGLLSFDVANSQALAAVLLYRGLTYWLPIVPGVIAFRYVRKRYL